MPDAGELFASVTSGDFDSDVQPPDTEVDALAVPATDADALPAATAAADADAEAGGGAAPDPARRVLAPDADTPKLHKVLAQAGVGSRRDLEQMILDKRVTVNGEPAHIGQRISLGDRVAVDGKPVRVRIAPLPHARASRTTSRPARSSRHDDPQQRPTVFRRLPRLQQGKWQSVGRLDINTEGLLLFTNSGELANQLMHPRFGVEREYAVRVLGTLDGEARARLLEGVEIEGQTGRVQEHRRRRRRGRQPLVPRRHHRRPQPRGAQAVRGGRPDGEPADPHPLRIGGAAARLAARCLGRSCRRRRQVAAPPDRARCRRRGRPCQPQARPRRPRRARPEATRRGAPGQPPPGRAAQRGAATRARRRRPSAGRGPTVSITPTGRLASSACRRASATRPCMPTNSTNGTTSRWSRLPTFPIRCSRPSISARFARRAAPGASSATTRRSRIRCSRRTTSAP